MNDEMERIWKEAVVAYSRCYSGSYQEGVRKTAKILGQDS
jgi:hypothetical protein